MRWSPKLHQYPPRLAAGAFILNSGIGKLGADEGTARWLHSTATTAYPFLERIEPVKFAKLLAYAEIGIGTALVLPVVPTAAAGALLTGFGGGLTGLYLRTPGMTEDDGIRPTQDGTALAKDSWLLGMGLGLFLDGMCHRRRHRHHGHDHHHRHHRHHGHHCHHRHHGADRPGTSQATAAG